MDKRFWVVLAAIAIILGGIFAITNSHKASAPSEKNGGLTNHVEGEGKTGVKLVEYGDFQCPACGQYYPIVKQVAEKYHSQITFQFRNFPLYQIHPNAIAGARAAEAADLQGKYWIMHDTLYEAQTTWAAASDPQPYFVEFARRLGLDTAKFKTDYASSLVNARIQADLKEGNKLGVTGTPTFFVDGKQVSNPSPTVEAFSKVIDAEITKKAGSNATPATTTQTPPQ